MTNPYASPKSRGARPQYGGIPRSVFIAYLLVVFISDRFRFHEGRLPPGFTDNGLLGLWFASLFVMMALRFKNTGASPWMAFWVLVPLANVYYVWACIVRQTGWAETEELDKLGWILCWPVVGILAGLAMVFVAGFVSGLLFG